MLLFIPASFSSAQTTSNPDSQRALKSLSLQELVNIEVISVSRSEGTLGRSPAAVFVITPAMIRRSGATTFPELFRMVPGMNVARIDGNKWAVSARGFNQRFQDKLLVQVDGRTVYTPAFSGVYWDTVDYPLEDVERIEIVRGPGASLWGANAVNGIINIITKSATDTQGGFVSGGAGSTERAFGTFRYGSQVGEAFSYRLYGNGFTRDETFAQVGDPHDGWQLGSGGTRIDWKPSAQSTFTLDGGYVHDVAGRRDERPQIAAPFSFLNLESETTDAGHVLGRWTRQRDQDNSWSVQAYWDRFSRFADSLPVRFNLTIYDVDMQRQMPLGRRHKAVFGAGYRLTDTFIGSSGRDQGFALTFDPPKSRFQLFGAFVHDQIALVPEKLELTLGTKLEHNSFTGVEVQPTARLLWTPTSAQAIWGAVSRAVRTPNLSEESGRATLLPSGSPLLYPRTFPNPGFQPEELIAYELGYRAQAGDTLTADLAVFYHDYDRLRATVPGTRFVDSLGATILPLVAQNAMTGKTYGTELSVQWQATKWWRLHAAHTQLKMDLRRRPDLAASTEAGEGQSPRQQVYVRSAWDLSGRVELDLMPRFVDRLKGFNPGGAGDAIPAYVSLDSRLAWRAHERLTLALVGRNLLDAHHPEFGTSTRIKAPLAEPRRDVYARVTLSW